MNKVTITASDGKVKLEIDGKELKRVMEYKLVQTTPYKATLELKMEVTIETHS